MKMVNTERMEVLNYCMGDTYCYDMKREVYEGLTASRKSLPSKYFYDARGSSLFEEICRLPEYYQTRTELSILREAAAEIMKNFKKGDLIELGSGANWKIKALLDAVDQFLLPGIRYVPVDVSETALLTAAEELLDLYPELNVFGIVADFTKHMEKIPSDGSKLFTFFGGTIGNFLKEDADRFLRNIAELMESGDRFLIGIDMVKAKETMERAYNDSRKVTAEFNKNVLNVINRELNATFDLSDFDHLSFFNEEQEQIEMHLKANRAVAVEVDDLDLQIRIAEGETIHTEISRKFSRESAMRMAAKAGLEIARWFTDERGWFSLIEIKRAGAGSTNIHERS